MPKGWILGARVSNQPSPAASGIFSSIPKPVLQRLVNFRLSHWMRWTQCFPRRLESWSLGRRVEMACGTNRMGPVPPTLSRISSVSKIFPVLMLYRLWEEGIVASLDDPLERYASTFTINNPLGVASAPQQERLMDGLEEVGPVPRPSPVTLRRMASQLSGEWF